MTKAVTNRFEIVEVEKHRDIDSWSGVRASSYTLERHSCDGRWDSATRSESSEGAPRRKIVRRGEVDSMNGDFTIQGVASPFSDKSRCALVWRP